MEVKVLGIDTNTKDIMSIVKGYLILMKQNGNMNKSYEWRDNCVAISFFKNILQYFCSILSANVESDPESLAAYIWVDSDMIHMTRISSLSVIKDNYDKVLYYYNIGEKSG